jgi:hypothetical protein
VNPRFCFTLSQRLTAFLPPYQPILPNPSISGHILRFSVARAFPQPRYQQEYEAGATLNQPRPWQQPWRIVTSSNINCDDAVLLSSYIPLVARIESELSHRQPHRFPPAICWGDGDTTDDQPNILKLMILASRAVDNILSNFHPYTGQEYGGPFGILARERGRAQLTSSRRLGVSG